MSKKPILESKNLRRFFVMKAARDSRVHADFLDRIRSDGANEMIMRRKAFIEYFQRCEQQGVKPPTYVLLISMLDEFVTVRSSALDFKNIMKPSVLKWFAKNEINESVLYRLVLNYFNHLSLDDLHRFIHVDYRSLDSNDVSGELTSLILDKCNQHGILLDEATWLPVSQHRLLSDRVKKELSLMAIGQINIVSAKNAMSTLHDLNRTVSVLAENSRRRCL